MEIELSRIVQNSHYNQKTLEDILLELENEKTLYYLLKELADSQKFRQKLLESGIVLPAEAPEPNQGKKFLIALKDLNLHQELFQEILESYKKILKSFWISTIGMCKRFEKLEICLKVFIERYRKNSSAQLGNQEKSVVENQYFDYEKSYLEEQKKSIAEYLDLNNEIRYQFIPLTLEYIKNNMNLKKIQQIDYLSSEFKINSHPIRSKINKILRIRANYSKKKNIVVDKNINMKNFYDDIKVLQNLPTSDQENAQNIYLKFYIKSLKQKLMSEFALNKDMIIILIDIYSYLKKNIKLDHTFNERFEYLIDRQLNDFPENDLNFILKYSSEILSDELMKKIFEQYQLKAKNTKFEDPKEVNIEKFKLAETELKSSPRLDYILAFILGSQDGHQVMVKKYSQIKNPILRIQFKKEAYFLQKFSEYSNFIKFYGIHEKEKDTNMKKYEISLYMEYCDSNLEEYIKYMNIKGLSCAPVEELFYVAEKISLALAEMTKAGIVHRDIKPDNIFIKNKQVKLADFSISNFFEDNLGKSGTQGFRAPELEGPGEKTDWNKCDIYSLGVTLMNFYFLYSIEDHLTYLFKEKAVEKLIKTIEDPEKTQVKYILCLLKRMMDNNPDNRPNIRAVLGYLNSIKIKSKVNQATELTIPIQNKTD